jgi:hypothetical protein
LAIRISTQAADLFEGQSVQITSICGELYDDLLEHAGICFDRRPEFALPIGKKLKSLSSATDPQKGEQLLDATYKVIRRLIKKFGLRRLKDVLDGSMRRCGRIKSILAAQDENALWYGFG